MGKIEVTIPEVEGLAAETSSVSLLLEGQVSSLVDLASSVLGSNWIGIDATAFAEGFSEWKLGAVEVQQALEQLGTLLSNSGAVYSEVEGDLARGISG